MKKKLVAFFAILTITGLAAPIVAMADGTQPPILPSSPTSTTTTTDGTQPPTLP